MSSTDLASERRAAWNAVMTASPGDLDLNISAGEIEGSIPAALRGGRILSNGARRAWPCTGHTFTEARYTVDKSHVEESWRGK